MKKSRALAILVFTLASFAPCYADHLAVVVAKDNNIESVTSADLAKMFKAENRKWPDGKTVVLVLHRDSIPQMETVQELNKMSAEELKSFFASHQDLVLFSANDVDVLKRIQTVPGAIGLIDVRSINDKVKVLKVDGKLPFEEGYLPHH
jgi:ABC-type phosphate transport system substrate-binding protein